MGRKGRVGEGRKALRLIDHFLSESSGVERRGIQFEDWDFDGEEICREGVSDHSVSAAGEKKGRGGRESSTKSKLKFSRRAHSSLPTSPLFLFHDGVAHLQGRAECRAPP